MSEDTTTSEQLAEIERQAEPLQVREGRWRTRNGDIRNVTPTPEGDEREERWPWLDAEYGQTWGHDGRYFSGGDSPLDLDTYLGPIEPQPEPQPVQVREGRWRKRSGAEVSVSAMPTDHDHFLAAFPWWDGQESTWTHSGHLLSGGECPADLVEYLGPIEPEDKTQELPDKTQELPDKTQELPAEYTPPEGWRVVRFGEQLLPGDMWVHQDGTEQRSAILHWDASAVSGGRCIRRIKPQPEPQPTTDDPSGPGWRDVEPDELLRYGDLFWNVDHWQATQHAGQPAVDERTYRRRIEPQPEPQPNAAAIEELRSEVAYVQRLLGESNRKVTQLEELVGSLRNINVTQEKAFTAAGKENTALRNQLLAVKTELASVAADRQQLRVELDATQQVPADSPELRQLRADLAEVTRERDQCKDAYDRIFADLQTIRETTTAEIVEAIAEWLEPIRLVDHPNLSNETLQHLPQIMRHLTGLDSHAID